MKLQIQNLLPLLESTTRLKRPKKVNCNQEGTIFSEFQNQGTRKLLFQLRNRLLAGR